jgi:hypothetical protein
VLEVNKIEAYKPTKTDPKELVEFYKARFSVRLFSTLHYQFGFVKRFLILSLCKLCFLLTPLQHVLLSQGQQ